MVIVLLLVSLLGSTAFVSGRCRWPIGATLFFVVSLIVAALYAAALAGALETAAFLVFAVGLVMSAAAGFTERGRAGLRDLASPSPALFFIAALLLWFRLRGESYAHWDEFSHWGLFTKVLALTDALPGPNSAVILTTYPPAAGIWQYFVTRVIGYSEGHVYVAQALLLLPPSLVVIDHRWRSWASIAGVIVLSYCAVFVFGNELQSLLIDQLLGVFFGGVLAAYFLSSRDAPAIVRAAPPLFCLVILKEAGILLAAIVAAIILFDQCMRRVWPQASDACQVAGTSRASARALYGALALLVVTPVIAAASWHVHVRMHNLGRPAAAGMTVEAVRRSFSADATRRDITTITRFREAIRTTAVGNGRTGQFFNALMVRLGVMTPVNVRATELHANLESRGWKPEDGTTATADGSGFRFFANDSGQPAAIRYRISARRSGRHSVSIDYRLTAGSGIMVTVLDSGTPRATSSASGTEGNLRVPFRAAERDFVIEIGGRGTSMESPIQIRQASVEGPFGLPYTGIIEPAAEEAVSVTQLVMVLIPVCLVVYFLQPQAPERRLFVAVSVALAVGFSAYLFGLLLLYLHSFSEYEGTRLMSFERYVGMYCLGWSVFLLGAIQSGFRSSGRRRWLAGAVTTSLVALFLYAAPATALEWPFRKASQLEIRRIVAQIARLVQSEVLPHESVYIVWQHTAGFEFYIMRYELAPRQTNIHGFTVGDPYSAADVWTWTLTPEQFATRVREFDFLLLASADDRFWDKYGSLFAPEAAGKTTVLFYSRGTLMGARLKVRRVIG